MSLVQEFYSEEEAEQILRRAAQKTVSTGIDRNRLLQMAEEAGISADEVLRAEREVVERRQNESIIAEFRAKSRASFFGEIWSYAGTFATVTFIWYLTGAGYFWPAWVSIAFILGIFQNFAAKMVPGSPSYQARLKKHLESNPLASPETTNRAFQLLDEYYSIRPDAQKLEGIKYLRDQMQLGLKDAKEITEAHAVRNRI